MPTYYKVIEMKPFRTYASVPLLVLLLWSVPCAVLADQDDSVSPDRARAAVNAGAIRPLAILIRAIDAKYLGTVVEAELHEQNGRWSYEFVILPDNGRLYRVYLDAAAGSVISTDGPVQERR